MQHFFVEPSQIQGQIITITGDDVNHIKNVLRMKEGQEVSVSNGIDDNDYRCEIDHFEEDQVVLRLRFVKADGIELPARITLFQGLPKSDKMELIIQKAVELGVGAIVPVATKRAVVKLDDKKSASKVARWQSISEAAAKQSKRAIIPEVMNVMSFKQAIEYASTFDLGAIPYELCEGMQDTKKFMEKAVNIAREKKDSQVAIFIGPEGGFAPEEVEMALQNNIIPISLGKRILRTETAGLATLAMMVYVFETEI